MLYESIRSLELDFTHFFADQFDFVEFFVGFDRTENLMVTVNVDTVDATAGATALLLPAQNIHTLPC